MLGKSVIEKINNDLKLQYDYGWYNCKQEVLRILNTPLQNLDLSEDWCDERYIEQIKKL